MARAGAVLLVGPASRQLRLRRVEAAGASYGWGVIPVLGCIGATQWETSLLPKNGGYVLPVKIAVRTREQVDVGDSVMVAVSIAPPPPRTPSQRCRSNLRITRWAVRTPSRKPTPTGRRPAVGAVAFRGGICGGGAV
jgi:hypothetical protein